MDTCRLSGRPIVALMEFPSHKAWMMAARLSRVSFLIYAYTANGSTCQEKILDFVSFWQYTGLVMRKNTPIPRRLYDQPLQIRVTQEMLEVFRQAAEKDGRPLSNWARDRLQKAAERELKRG